MSLVENPLKKRTDDYRLIFFRYQDLITSISIEADKALMTFSIAGLAALAALNKLIFDSYGWLSFFTLLCFIGVIITVTIGYYILVAALKDAQHILTENYRESIITPLSKNSNKVKYLKLGKAINLLSILFFSIAMILFVILMAFYIKGLGV